MGIKISKKMKGRSKERLKKKDSLRHHLHKQLQNNTKARSIDIVHASEMLKKKMYGADFEFCPREYALLDELGQTRPDEYIKTCSQMVFNFGNRVADIIVDTLGDANLAIGDWECQYCSKKYKFQQRPYQCVECDHDRFDYIECRFTSKESGISCGVDTLVPTLQKKHRIIEIKSIKDEEFKKLEAPLSEHRWRTNLYMRIVADSSGTRKNRILTDEATIIYVSKGGYGCKDLDLHKQGITDGPFSPFKEFIVKREDKSTDLKWYHAKVLKEFREGKRGMMKGICKTSVCKRAQGCPVSSQCFGGKYKGHD